jgi:hypothetical protein
MSKADESSPWEGHSRSLVTLGKFIIDEFTFEDEDGRPTGRTMDPQVRLNIQFQVSKFIASILTSLVHRLAEEAHTQSLELVYG